MKPTLITNELIRRTFNEANTDEECAGVITWMHTFSPAKSWILGLQEYRKPLLHLHTQFNEELPYDTIDMDFMNENQSAHGDREYGHIVSRMGIERKVVVGHWADRQVQERIASWMRTAVGVVESSHIRVMRVADNMRNVAVTEGDKVEAQIKFGWEVDAYPVNEIAESVAAVSASDTNALVDEYYDKYEILLEGRDPEEFKRHVAVQAQIELGFERFLQEKNYQAIVTHFGDLGALKQLPGLAIQRLMEKGYGFGAEGDWKVAAMVRLMKVMTAGMKDAKGTSMLEDYTYNFVKGKEGILEAHMLEICPSIADGPISIKCQPLTMGDREDPARLVFTSKEGKGIATSLIDLGNRFRLIINDVDCKKTEKPMPKLPVATNFWTPQPDLYTGAEAWILAGGAHHTAFTYDLTAEQMGDWAAAMGTKLSTRSTKIRIYVTSRKILCLETLYIDNPTKPLPGNSAVHSLVRQNCNMEKHEKEKRKNVMKFFIDTANVEDIRKANDMGVICGVTTNPSLIAKEGRDFTEVIKEITSIVDGPISGEVKATTTDAEGMIKEGREIAAIHKNMVVKIPMTVEGLKAVKALSAEGIKTNVTLIFSANQALLAAEAGATYVSPFLGRLDDISQPGIELVRTIAEIFDIYGYETEIIAASVRNPIHVTDCALAGADIATVPYKVIEQMTKHPLTDQGIEKFQADYRAVFGD